MKRALLLQLPPPSFRWPTLDPNIPLAAGCLAAWCAPHLPGWELHVPGWEISDLLGDAALSSYLLAQDPEVVGFSLYGWNVERSLALAERLRGAGVSVVFGGPEVTGDQPLLPQATRVGTLIEGEGEEAFLRLLAEGLPTEGSRLRGSAVDLSGLPSPYREGLLPPWPDGSVWLETVRGCPFHCAYCRYGKGAAHPRPFSRDWLLGHLEWAFGRDDVTEVYLMDPSFNVRPDWEEVLGTLERGAGSGRLGFHTELLADALRPGDATRLAQAGLRSCELGLQSVHPRVLSRVGRRWEERRWRAGVDELLAAGVHTTVGLILGLPGDSPTGFRSSVEYLQEHCPGADIQVFPLACLPGTPLRRDAARHGVHHLDRPPYTIEEGVHFPREELAGCLDWFEETTGLEVDPVDLPDLSGSWHGGEAAPYWSGVALDAPAAGMTSGQWVPRLIRKAARNLTVWARGWHEDLPAWIAALMSELPHGVLSVVMDDGAGWDPCRLTRLLDAGTGDHYLDRSHRLLYGAGARLVPRLCVLVDWEEPRAPERWQASVRRHAELLWRLPALGEWRLIARRLLATGESVFVTGEVRAEDLPALGAAAGTEARGAVFESALAQRLWNPYAGHDGFRAPEHRVALP